MVAPQLLINTKTKNEEDDNEGIELETKQEQAGEMKEKEDDNDSIDLAKDTCNGNNKNRKASSRPFLTYIISPILVFKGLTIALVGVSFDEKDGILMKYDYPLSPGLSVGKTQICLPLFRCAWSSRVLAWSLLHCPRSSQKVGKIPALLPSQMGQPKTTNPYWHNCQCSQYHLHSPGNPLLGKKKHTKLS